MQGRNPLQTVSGDCLLHDVFIGSLSSSLEMLLRKNDMKRKHEANMPHACFMRMYEANIYASSKLQECRRMDHFFVMTAANTVSFV